MATNLATRNIPAVQQARAEFLPASHFQRAIMQKGLVPAGVDPRHIEGYVRLEYSILGSLSWPTIRREVRIALACIEEAGVDEAEACARSWGL